MQKKGTLHVQFVIMLYFSQLDYKVTERKLRDVFRMAGNVKSCELKVDKEGKSRGMGIVQFEHPMEAVQAICILDMCDFSSSRFIVQYTLEKETGSKFVTVSAQCKIFWCFRFSP